MRKARRGAVIAVVSMVVLSCNGCWIVSIHPLHTPETSVFQEKLLGTWLQQAKPSDQEENLSSLTVARAEGNKYTVTFETKSKPDETVAFDGKLVRLGEHYYLDLALHDDNAFLREIPEVGDVFLLPVHAFFRVELQDDKLTLVDMLGPGNGPGGGLRNLSTNHGGIWVLFASTSQLQESFRREGETIFAKGGRMEWQRRPLEPKQ